MRIIVGTLASESVTAAKRLVQDITRSGVDSRLLSKGLLSTNLWANRYEVRGLIAAGAQGTVFEVFDRAAGTLCAAKIFDRGRARDWDDEKLFRREAEVLRALKHPLIPRFVDALVDDDVGVRVLIMERLAGETLAAVVREVGPISPEHAGWILADVLNALSTLHAAGLVHRDVKPANLLLCSDAMVRLVDFGAVGFVRGGGSTLGVGTLGYVAPEQLHGAHSPRSDLFSLAMTMVAIISGKEPAAFPRRGLTVDVDRAVPALSRPMRKLIGNMLSLEPDERPDSAATVARELGEHALAGRPQVPPRQAKPEPRRREAERPQARQPVLPRSDGSPDDDHVVKQLLWLEDEGRFIDVLRERRPRPRSIAQETSKATAPPRVVIAPPREREPDAASAGAPARPRGLRGGPEGESDYDRDAAELRTTADRPKALVHARPAKETWVEVVTTTLSAAPGFKPDLRVSYLDSSGECIGTETVRPADRDDFVRWWRSRAGQPPIPSDTEHALLRRTELVQHPTLAMIEPGLSEDRRLLVLLVNGVELKPGSAKRIVRRQSEDRVVPERKRRPVSANVERSAETIRRLAAAEGGDPDAQFALGWDYADGNGVAKDDILAVTWWRKAAEQGHADGQDSLAVAYLLGRGVAKDDFEAVAWWRLAAAQGHADAQDSLDWAARHGRGIDQPEADDDDAWPGPRRR